jgi:hypothetical protein
VPPLKLPPTSYFERLFATWNRLEPRSRAADFSQGLEARTADPLWMLGRQWQLAEFAASNAGSPVEAELTYETSAIGRVDIGNVSEALTLPMEVRVEQERVEWDWRLRVRVGQHFERLARDRHPDDAPALVAWARGNFGIAAPSGAERAELDRATQRFLTLMAGRAIDGGELLAAWDNDTDLPGLSALVVSGEATAEDMLVDLLTELAAWYGRLYSQSDVSASAAWKPERLDYEFGARASESATAPNPIPAEWSKPTLIAPSYRNGELDWYASDVSNLGRVTWTAAPPKTYAPTRVMFPGMPHARWWAFENHRVDFGAMDVATTDVVKLALMEFAIVYGDDWFLAPLELPLGVLARVTSLRVRDVFGRRDVVHRARNVGANAARWEVFALSRRDGGDGGGAQLLYLPPILGFREESAAVEEVRWVRDEGANMVWAVEHTVQNDMGEPTNGFDLQRERLDVQRELREQAGLTEDDASDAEAAAAALRYRLATLVPENWIPFVPADVPRMLANVPTRSVRLRRARMLTNTSREVPVPIEAMTRLLDPSNAAHVDWIQEESVGRSGVTVQLTRQRARSTTGETYVWLGRRVVTGKGEASSGLRFDVLEKV